MVYDSAGRIIAATNGAGTSCNTYDSEGRLTSDKAPDEGNATTYTYDPAGAQRTATTSLGVVTTEYDEAGRVKRSIDSHGAESTFLYDARGNLKTQTAAVGALGSNPNYTTNYSYNDADQLTSLTDPAGRVYTFTYDARGNLHTIQMPNGTFVWQDFNSTGWLTGLYNRHGTLSVPPPPSLPSDTNPISDYTYTYSVDGKKTQEMRSGGGFTAQTTDYTYDTFGRLATANLPDANNSHTLRTYTYDLDSNRVEVKDGSTVVATGVYDPTDPDSAGVDQLTRYTSGGTTKDYFYTPDGQVSARGSDSFTWDGRGRMAGGTFGAVSLTYAFDATGRMRSRTSGGSVTHFRYAGSSAMFDTTSAGVIQRTGVAGLAGDLAHYLGAPQTGITTEFLYYTGHGDLAATADEAGVRSAAFTYDPFGVPLQTPPTNASVERWTGRWDKRLDTTSSLIQMGARPYDPILGRFLAVDPIEGGSLNNYEYGGQDPINAYDLSGTRRVGIGETCGACWNPIPFPRPRMAAWRAIALAGAATGFAAAARDDIRLRDFERPYRWARRDIWRGPYATRREAVRAAKGTARGSRGKYRPECKFGGHVHCDKFVRGTTIVIHYMWRTRG
jgi:RHS repeat-associated protein